MCWSSGRRRRGNNCDKLTRSAVEVLKNCQSLRLVAPDSELRTVTLRRLSNRDMGRDREHLTEHEVERLIKVARGNRYGQRDATMILIGFRHGLRVSS